MKAKVCPHGIIPLRNCKECHRINAIKSDKRTYADRKKYYEKYKLENPEKRKAKNYVKNHKLPLSPTCEFCDSPQNLQHHHPDYGYPEIYVTTCAKCHYHTDRNTRETI